jgi:hypothetical protein
MLYDMCFFGITLIANAWTVFASKPAYTVPELPYPITYFKVYYELNLVTLRNFGINICSFCSNSSWVPPFHSRSRFAFLVLAGDIWSTDIKLDYYLFFLIVLNYDNFWFFIHILSFYWCIGLLFLVFLLVLDVLMEVYWFFFINSSYYTRY